MSRSSAKNSKLIFAAMALAFVVALVGMRDGKVEEVPEGGAPTA